MRQVIPMMYGRVLILGFLMFQQPVFAENDVDWGRWALFDPTSTAEVQYGPLDSILETVSVDYNGAPHMRYDVLGAKKPLHYVTRYIQYLESLPVSRLNRDEQLAYWLNLHNLGVIHLFATNSRADRKVKKLRGVPGAPGEQWRRKIFTVEAQALSLEDIEQKILFEQWHDPFTLYGLCYGVKGSPPVGTEAFKGKRVHAQLEAMGKRFVNDKEHVRTKRRGLEVSKLYTWNKAVLFGDNDVALVNHIQSLADDKLEQEIIDRPVILGDRFSWRSVALVPRRLEGAGTLGLGRGATGGGS